MPTEALLLAAVILAALAAALTGFLAILYIRPSTVLGSIDERLIKVESSVGQVITT
jgi:hypothetical protein